MAAVFLAGGLTVGMSVATTSSASAEGCDLAGVFCGGVRNNADYTMHYTRGLGSSGHTEDCDVWNSAGGNSWNWNKLKCGHRALEKGGARGGAWSDFDVDAFTFNTHRYEVQFDGGSWRQLNQGVWTKLNNVQAGTCYMASGTIRCQIDSAL